MDDLVKDALLPNIYCSTSLRLSSMDNQMGGRWVEEKPSVVTGAGLASL
jgi:hypothetical protein